MEVGGFEYMSYKYERAVPNTTLYSDDTCGLPREDSFKLMRDPVSGDIPWPGIPGLVLNSIWYWCADQVAFKLSDVRFFTSKPNSSLL